MSSGRELVHATVVCSTAVNCGAVKISERIDNHAVIGKAAIGRTLERVNYTFAPLTAANVTELENSATA